jgi:antitoxin HicB
MNGTRVAYPARLEIDEEGRYLVRFPDLPEALTAGADEAEALIEAADCLSEALAGRIHRGEELPRPSPARRSLREVAPDPTIALKAALYSALRRRGVTVPDLAQRLGIDERRAARLLEPRARTPLASLEEALSAFGYTIGIEVREKRVA